MQGGKCFWLDIDIDFTMKDWLRSPSLDRLDNTKGYTIDNVVLTTRFANLGRSVVGQKDMRKFVNKYLYK